MVVGGFAATSRDEVDVEVEDRLVEHPHIESGFLPCFAQGHLEGAGGSVAMSAGLQPSPELAVVREQHAVSRPVHDPGRARDVTDLAGTLEAVRMGVDEGFEARHGLRFLRPPLAVRRQACLELVSVHAVTPIGSSTGVGVGTAPRLWRLAVPGPLAHSGCPDVAMRVRRAVEHRPIEPIAYSHTTPSPSPSRMYRYAGCDRCTGAIPCRRASLHVILPFRLSS